MKACRDVKGDNLESMNRGVRSGYKVKIKVRLLWNKLESNPIFLFLVEKKEFDSRQRRQCLGRGQGEGGREDEETVHRGMVETA